MDLLFFFDGQRQRRTLATGDVGCSKVFLVREKFVGSVFRETGREKRHFFPALVQVKKYYLYKLINILKKTQKGRAVLFL